MVTYLLGRSPGCMFSSASALIVTFEPLAKDALGTLVAP